MLLLDWSAATGNDGEQRICDIERGFRWQAQQFTFPPRGERGGENDDGRAKLAKARNQFLDERSRVEVVAVNFIQHDDFTREGKLSNEEMFRRDDAQQGLVNRADTEGSQQRALRRGKPMPDNIGSLVGSSSRGDESHRLVL